MDHQAWTGVAMMMVAAGKVIRRRIVLGIVGVMVCLQGHGHGITEDRMVVRDYLRRRMLDLVDHLRISGARIDQRQRHAEHDEKTVNAGHDRFWHAPRLTAWMEWRKGRAQLTGVSELTNGIPGQSSL